MPGAKADPVQVLRALAMKYPGVEEAIACKGTAAESAAFQIRKRTFLSARPVAMILKLQDSLAEAMELAQEEPGHYKTGSSGWVTVKFAAGGLPPKDVLVRWIDESYHLFATPPQKKTKRPEPAKRPCRAKSSVLP